MSAHPGPTPDNLLMFNLDVVGVDDVERACAKAEQALADAGREHAAAERRAAILRGALVELKELDAPIHQEPRPDPVARAFPNLAGALERLARRFGPDEPDTAEPDLPPAPNVEALRQTVRITVHPDARLEHFERNGTAAPAEVADEPAKAPPATAPYGLRDVTAAAGRALEAAPAPEPDVIADAAAREAPKPPAPELVSLDAVRVVRDTMAALGDPEWPAWLGSGAVNAAIPGGLRTGKVTAAMRELVRLGEAEHNGKGGAYSRFRLTTPQTPQTAPQDGQEQADPKPPPVVAYIGDSLGPAAAGLDALLEEEAPVLGRLAGGPGPADSSVRRLGPGTLEGRALESLAWQPATLPELATALGVPLNALDLTLAGVVAKLEAEGEVEPIPDATRNGRPVYRVTAPLKAVPPDTA